ncbi:haloalkane dehalogenase [Euzebya tangerina]|uniref:haloalkane dehalogenase n=1 Tax=Euzebya tangerina TaxID=591198 RepID=UPI000E30F7D0|nr:haloalkane dehalogenase [Euzebya tangerina]
MDLLRTPEDRFADLPDWPYAPHQASVGSGLTMAYVDEGPVDASPVLLLHGEPSWSYLYRFMIPPLLEAGHRVVAPDLIGFGRSDKPADRSAHTYADHVAWMTEFVVERLDLTDITLFCQDWGGLIGLRVLAENPDRFGRAMVANTGLPTGDQSMSEAFMAWQRFSQTVEEFPIGSMVQGATLRELSEAEVAAYDAPFPDESFKEGPRAMPALVPTSPDDPASAAQRAAWKSLMAFDKPVVVAFSDNDPITSGGEKVFHKLVPGTAGQDHFTPTGGHFLQEDAGPELAAALARLIRN